MTYMYENPEYLKVPLGKNISTRFPQYKLHVYGEGQYARQILSSKYKLTGIPVLFIPGNAGSYRQVRSLGSVALRMARDTKSKYHFNYFSVDLNEEYAGLYGGVLQRQTEFVHHCIKKILSLYKNYDHPPKSVLLVGHSLGGIVARALFTLPDFRPKLVNTIITQATPHQMPVIPLDRTLGQFYQKVNGYWKTHSKTSLNHVILVSTGGGMRDILVRNDLTSLQDIADEDHWISSSTTAVPKAWVSTDHLCSVWCRQMVLATKRALFDIIDPETKQISEDVDLKMSAFRYHFVSHTGAKKLNIQIPDQLVLEKEGLWVLKQENIWTFSELATTSLQYLVVPVKREEVDTFLVVSNVKADNWICGCTLKEGEDRCSNCENLSGKGKLIPPNYAGKRTLELSVEELGEITHIVLLVPPSTVKVEIMSEWHTDSERHLAYQLPGLFDLLITFPDSIFGAGTVLHLPNDTLHHRLKLRGFTGVLKSYKASLEPRFCLRKSNDPNEGSMMSLHVPWSHEDSFSFSRLGETVNLSLKLQSGKADDMTGDVELDLFLHPSCWYLLKISATPFDMAQFVRFYGFLLPVFFVAIILLTLAGQLRSYNNTNSFPDIITAVRDYTKPLYLVPGVLLSTYILQFSAVQQILGPLGLLDDTYIERKSGLWFQFLPLMLFIIALNVTCIQMLVFSFGINNMSKLAGLIFVWLPDSVFRLGWILQLAMCAVSVLVSVTLCGGLGIFVCHVLLYIKVLRTCYLSRKSSDEQSISKYNFYLSLFFLWFGILVINSPTLVVWLKNLQYSVMLTSDPSLPVALICCSTLFVILYLDNPESGRPGYGIVAMVIHCLAVVMVAYGMVTVYRIPYFITVVLLLIVSSQIVHTFFLNPQPKSKSE